MTRPAVFLDRDGTLNREVHYLARVEDFEWLPGTIDGLAALDRAGYALVVVTNQSGIAQGLLDTTELNAIHARMAADLAQAGVALAGVYFCPHHPELGQDPWRCDCDCRKPRTGMLRRALRELDLDPARSWFVGDSLRDLEAGHAIGARSILVRTGKGADQGPAVTRALPDAAQVDDLAAAARHILAHG
ncbi:MAG: D-glycero-beta-D-manno-heptose 1,7-bisphosphate 7-phosphatase [Planctomycetota bacterium]